MTFCAQVKQEITQSGTRNGCCAVAHLYGILLFAKVFTLGRITVSSEHAFVVEHIRQTLLEFGIQAEQMRVSKTARDHTIHIADKQTIDRIFFDFGYTGEEPSVRIIRQNFLCDQCAAAFVAGCFLTGGNITAPEKGYHLEFSTHKSNLYKDMAALLDQLELKPLQAKRGYAKILYYKNSTQIEDILTLMGAVQSSLALMNTKIYKGIMNSVNRRTNCENANIDKAVDAAARDCDAINYINNKKGKGYLPEDLREIARLRLAYPELPLGELGGMLEKPLSKSGANHRMRRIREEAQRLKEQGN